jgi:hypothetical protein
MKRPKVSVEELTTLPEYYPDYIQLRKANNETTYFARISLVIRNT